MGRGCIHRVLLRAPREQHYALTVGRTGWVGQNATGMSDEEINQAGYEGEKGYHGTPSGIDNTASTYGGFLKFRRTAEGPKFEACSTPEPCHIAYASTGITASTTKVVGDVKKLKEAEPEKFEGLMTE